LGVWVRNKLFDAGILRSESFSASVVCVGNLAVGGTGKTPHTEYLITLLCNTGRQVAVLSRGYRRAGKGYLLADAETSARLIGDEPYQMKQKFPDVRVAVDEKRVHGIRRLLQLANPQVDVILLDDAFQHRYVKAGLNILLTDYHRMFPFDALLPAGLLREPQSGKKRADIVIVTKCPHDCKPADMQLIAGRLALHPHQKLYFSTFSYGNLTPLMGGQSKALDALSEDIHILLLTGIAAPDILQAELEKYTPYLTLCTFADHHEYTDKELKQIGHLFDEMDGTDKLIVTTEKDAARLVNHPALSNQLKSHIYILPVVVEFLQNQANSFNKNIIDYVTANPRNSSLP
jgi:tetraacyldisaccharide 4'-kinase